MDLTLKPLIIRMNIRLQCLFWLLTHKKYVLKQINFIKNTITHESHTKHWKINQQMSIPDIYLTMLQHNQ